jgi:hypothetical protein
MVIVDPHVSHKPNRFLHIVSALVQVLVDLFQNQLHEFILHFHLGDLRMDTQSCFQLSQESLCFPIGGILAHPFREPRVEAAPLHKETRCNC